MLAALCLHAILASDWSIRSRDLDTGLSLVADHHKSGTENANTISQQFITVSFPIAQSVKNLSICQICQVGYSVRNLWDEITGQFQMTGRVTKLDRASRQLSFYTPAPVRSAIRREYLVQYIDSTCSTIRWRIFRHCKCQTNWYIWAKKKTLGRICHFSKKQWGFFISYRVFWRTM